MWFPCRESETFLKTLTAVAPSVENLITLWFHSNLRRLCLHVFVLQFVCWPAGVNRSLYQQRHELQWHGEASGHCWSSPLCSFSLQHQGEKWQSTVHSNFKTSLYQAQRLLYSTHIFSHHSAYTCIHLVRFLKFPFFLPLHFFFNLQQYVLKTY